MRDDFVGNGGELGLAGVESEPKGAVGTNEVRRPMEQGSDKAQDIAAHYELICEDWRAGKEVYLAGRFDKLGRRGLTPVGAAVWGRGGENPGAYRRPGS